MNGDGVRTIACYVVLGVIAIGAIIAAMVGVVYLTIRRGERETVQAPADAIVVLGAQVHNDGTPSAALRGRVQRAVMSYRAGLAPRLILTGGVGASGIAEAGVMEALALAQGVPASALVLEPRAKRTVESARAVGAIARVAGWRSVIVVSDPFHLWRSALLFRAEGLAVQTAATHDWYFSSRSRRYYRVREMSGLIAQTMNGEIPLRAWWETVKRRRITHDD